MRGGCHTASLPQPCPSSQPHTEPFTFTVRLFHVNNTMEALGGAASVIGVASLAIQICHELEKVHDF